MTPNHFAPIRKTTKGKYVCNYHFIIPIECGYLITAKLKLDVVIDTCTNLGVAQLYCNLYLN